MSDPIIIWTFRRSGGTNLAEAMFRVSEWTAIEHEPFNSDRKFGAIIQSYLDTRDVDALYSSLDSVIKNKYLIKHCLELMPREFNCVLMELCIKYGYRHVFLYRERPSDRLLSLNYALKTGIWGRGQKEQIVDPHVFDAPIDTKHFIKHERMCREEMSHIYSTLIDLSQTPISVSFENLYQSDLDYSKILVKDIFKELKLDQTILTEQKLTDMLKNGSQGTKSDYLKFPNSQEFLVEVNKISGFTFHQYSDATASVSESEDYKRKINVFSARPSIFDRKYHIIGTFMTEKTNSYYIEWYGQKINIQNGFKSNNLSKKNPDNPLAVNARFISEPTFISGDLKIVSNYNVIARLHY